MNLTQKLCATNVSLQTLLSKDKNLDMLTMFNSWILLRFKILWAIGSLEVINSKELDIYMDIMLKILTTKEVLELLLKLFMNQNRQVLTVILKFLKKKKVLSWIQSLRD